jgi:hypothetical protein
VHVRHCPTCRTDYRPEITCCADCGGTLEDRDDEQEYGEAPRAAAAESRAADDLPEGFVPIHTSRDIDALPPLADELIASGIDCRIREVQSAHRVTGYRLCVAAQDRSAAAKVLAPFLHPEDAADFDSDRGYARCPACDLALPPHTLQCPECGLLLGTTQVTCGGCGALVDASAEQCGECGAALWESDSPD